MAEGRQTVFEQGWLLSEGRKQHGQIRNTPGAFLLMLVVATVRRVVQRAEGG